MTFFPTIPKFGSKPKRTKPTINSCEAMNNSKNMLYPVFGPDLNANSNYVVGSNGIARRGTPQAEWILKSRATTPRPVAHSTTSKSKLQAIKPIPENETVSTAQPWVKEPVTVESKPMKPNLKNTSLLEFVKDPAFRWAVLCVLLAVLIFCLWPRDEYVSMGHGLILNKRTGEVHRAYDRLNK